MRALRARPEPSSVLPLVFFFGLQILPLRSKHSHLLPDKNLISAGAPTGQSPSVPGRTGHPSLVAAREMEILLIKGAKFIESNFGAPSSRSSVDVEEVEHERVHIVVGTPPLSHRAVLSQLPMLIGTQHTATAAARANMKFRGRCGKMPLYVCARQPRNWKSRILAIPMMRMTLMCARRTRSVRVLCVCVCGVR